VDSTDAASDNTGHRICQQETEVSSHSKINGSVGRRNKRKSKRNINTVKSDLFWLEVKTENLKTRICIVNLFYKNLASIAYLFLKINGNPSRKTIFPRSSSTDYIIWWKFKWVIYRILHYGSSSFRPSVSTEISRSVLGFYLPTHRNTRHKVITTKSFFF
jgi:hypothetical protein